MRKHHLQTHMMLILNNLIKLLIPNLVLTVPITKLNFHSITKETLISHKKSLLNKLIFKTHKMISLLKSILRAISCTNKASITINVNKEKQIFLENKIFTNKNLTIKKTLNNV